MKLDQYSKFRLGCCSACKIVWLPYASFSFQWLSLLLPFFQHDRQRSHTFTTLPLIQDSTHISTDRTLASYKTLAALPPASPTSIATYRSFLTAHNPIAAPETAFLDQTSDLVSVSCPCNHTASHACADDESIQAGERSVLRTVGAVLVFVAVWKMVPSFLGRLVLGVAVLGGCVWCGVLPRVGAEGECGVEGRGWGGVG